MMDELKKVREETELKIDENTLSLKLEDSYRRSDDCMKIIMDIAHPYYCGYIMTIDSYDTTPVDAISLTPPVFFESITIKIRSVWLPTEALLR
jgi:hypothetical protein